MGDPRRLKKKFETPMHPWRRASIDAERELRKEYALKNKQEIWRMDSLLRSLKNQAKSMIALRTAQADKERTQLLMRLQRLGLISAGAKLDDVLRLTTKNIMERRLQSFVFRKGLAHSMKQARQFITHNHLEVKGRIVNAPSHIVTKAEEELIQFASRSPFLNSDHPERVIHEKSKEEPRKQESTKKKQEKNVEQKVAPKTEPEKMEA